MNLFPVHFQPRMIVPPMADGCGRPIGYLRISVVDRCNLRCTYCRPEGDDFHAAPRNHLLGFDEIERIARITIGLGVEKIRLTGGEPLVRKGIVSLVARIAALPGLRDLSLSTNGILLDDFAHPLREAGMGRINISLDSLAPHTFTTLTGGSLHKVLSGIHVAQDAGLTPIRINAVLLRGINEHEAAPLIDFCIREQLELRFIELMPMREGMDWHRHYYSTTELLAQPAVLERIDLRAAERQPASAARYFPLRHAPGRVGFIEPMSNRFCEGCNRLRLMSDGKLRPCLSADHEMDLRAALRNGSSDETLITLIRSAAASKQANSAYLYESTGRQRSMIAIGG